MRHSWKGSFLILGGLQALPWIHINFWARPNQAESWLQNLLAGKFANPASKCFPPLKDVECSGLSRGQMPKYHRGVSMCLICRKARRADVSFLVAPHPLHRRLENHGSAGQLGETKTLPAPQAPPRGQGRLSSNGPRSVLSLGLMRCQDTYKPK